jgi:hypothetical protein
MKQREKRIKIPSPATPASPPSIIFPFCLFFSLLLFIFAVTA